MKNKLKLIPLKIFYIVIGIGFFHLIHSEPANLTLLKNKIKTYHDCGTYMKEIAQVISKADNYITKQIKINNTNKSQKLAVVLDIDETSLSNYEHMISRDFSGTREDFHQDVMQADSPVIQPTLKLYNKILKNHIAVFFVTGRRISERNATKNNLHKAGFNNWAGLYLRPEHYNYMSMTPFKTQSRRSIRHQGYLIIANIGDQYSDLQGGYALKTFKLPNPYYYLP